MSSSDRLAITPPQAPIKWDHSTEYIRTKTEEAISISRKLNDSVAALKPEECNFKSVFETLAQGAARFSVATGPLVFYKNVATSDDVREAAIASQESINKYTVESQMRIDVYEALINADKNMDKSQLTLEQKRLVEKMILDGKRAGLALPEEKREKLKDLKEALAKARQEFSNNYNQEKGFLEFTREELKGVPESVLKQYKEVENGKLRVTFKTPDYTPLVQYAQSIETRKTMSAGMEDRLKINVPVFDKILDIRRQCAELLGYDTWAEYVLEDCMIKSATAAAAFLDDVQQKLNPIGQENLQNLLALKKKEHEELGIPFDHQFYIWDWGYYNRKYTETTFSMDNNFIKEHFPVDFIVPAILDIYKELLHVRIEEVPNAVVWHPDVKQYSAWELDATDESGFLGFLHLDLYPRENKYGHAVIIHLIPGFEENGKRYYPASCMVANLAKPTEDSPGLMSHKDVVIFFHEMGHAWHDLLSRTQYSRFHGTSVARDFVEAPSQMLENWCFEKLVLQRISRHYKTGEPLSDDLIQKIIDSRYVNIGLYKLFQVFFGKFDQAIHTSKERIDVNKAWEEMRENIYLIKGFDPVHYKPGYAALVHFTDGYDAQCYSYLYSLVFAYDMYESVFKADPLSPIAGKRYRDSILRPGGSRDELSSIEEFLGRPPNSEAFANALFGSQKKLMVREP